MPKVRPVCSMVSFLAHDITSISFASSCSFLLHLATWVSFSFFPKVSVDLWIDESSGLSFTSKEIFFLPALISPLCASCGGVQHGYSHGTEQERIEGCCREWPGKAWPVTIAIYVEAALVLRWTEPSAFIKKKNNSAFKFIDEKLKDITSVQSWLVEVKQA